VSRERGEKREEGREKREESSNLPAGRQVGNK